MSAETVVCTGCDVRRASSDLPAPSGSWIWLVSQARFLEPEPEPDLLRLEAQACTAGWLFDRDLDCTLCPGCKAGVSRTPIEA